MTVTAASFRMALPAFASQANYPDDAVTFWISVATMMLNPQVWGAAGVAAQPPAAAGPMTSPLDFGTILFVAHNLVLEQQAGKAAAKGNAPGLNKGVISSESVGPASAGYDTSAGLELDAGHWNLTVYGTRFVRLANMVGTLIVTGGGGFDPTGQLGYGPAWPGPPGALFPWWGG